MGLVRDGSMVLSSFKRKGTFYVQTSLGNLEQRIGNIIGGEGGWGDDDLVVERD